MSRPTWQEAGKPFEAGPMQAGKAAAKWILLVAFGLFLLSIPLGLLDFGGNWFGEAKQVAQEEFGPRALLQKYEWFKDAAAQLDKKQADIRIYEERLTAMEADYAGTPRAQWDRTDKEQRSIWLSEAAGVKASYNALAGEYNAAMSKANWRFCEVGMLPPGAIVPLPREFKPYVTH